MMIKRKIMLGIALLLSVSAHSQLFGSETVISDTVIPDLNEPQSVVSVDLDLDGDNDVLTADRAGGRVVWYENLGGGVFSSVNVIDVNVGDVLEVYTFDIDNDGDLDVFSVSYVDDLVYWFENLGSGNFSTKNVISNSSNTTNGPASIGAGDIDGDGDVDVVVSSGGSWNDRVVWFENTGLNTFPSYHILPEGISFGEVYSIYVVDIDNDGDLDVLQASFEDGIIAWSQNLGGGTFANLSVLTTNAAGARRVYPSDIDGDGDLDVVTASITFDRIAWHENLGGGNFSTQNIISNNVINATGVYTADFDGDGDMDVLACGPVFTTNNNAGLCWFENVSGNGSVFSAKKVISSGSQNIFSVYVADIDGDGAEDVLSAAIYSDRVSWYRNKQLCNTTSTLNVSICQGESYYIDSIPYSSSGNYIDTLSNAEGCDSIVTLNLTVNQLTTGTDIQTACDSYTWIDGITYNNSNSTATYPLTNAAGCDSIVTLNLIITNSTTGTDTQTACDSYTWIDGITYNNSNSTATHPLTNAAGCDSVVTLNLTIISIDATTTTSNETITANQNGASYQWMDCIDGLPITGETSQSFTATTNGDYGVIVSQGSCSETSACVTISSVGIVENTFGNDILLYPNPTEDLVTLELGELIDVQIIITDLLGKVIYTNNKGTNQTVIISMKEFVNGIYLLNVVKGNDKRVFSLVKK